MMLALYILLPMLGGLAAACLGRRAAWAALVALAADLALVLAGAAGTLPEPANWRWIPALGIHVSLAMDGLSLVMVLLALFLGVLAVLAEWPAAQPPQAVRSGLYWFCLQWTLAGVIGVFLARDLFLFYLFWELMLVPMYGLFFWGEEGRAAAGMKFFLYTQASGLFMLLAILALFFAAGARSFAYDDLLGHSLRTPAAVWAMAGFFVAFAVKMGAVPLHGWLPDAYTHAPTAGSAILAGVMAKAGAYGMIRFVLPLFADVAGALAVPAMTLGAAGVLYGAIKAFAQTDLKRLIAYASISSMGFVLLGVFSWNALGLQGAVLLIVSHGVTIAGLFFAAGAIQSRLGTRDLREMGGLWAAAPRLGGVMTALALSALALPGLGTFLGEFLILLGAWQAGPVFAIIAAVGMVFTLIYAVCMLQTIFHGPTRRPWRGADLGARELATGVAIILVLVWLGTYPRPVLDATAPVVGDLDALYGMAEDEPQAFSAASIQPPGGDR